MRVLFFFGKDILTDVCQRKEKEEKRPSSFPSTLSPFLSAFALALQPYRSMARLGSESFGRKEGIQDVLSKGAAELVGNL
jgi:hypothetical protein